MYFINLKKIKLSRGMFSLQKLKNFAQFILLLRLLFLSRQQYMLFTHGKLCFIANAFAMPKQTSFRNDNF